MPLFFSMAKKNLQGTGLAEEKIGRQRQKTSRTRPILASQARKGQLKTGTEVIKLFSSLTQLSMKFSLLMNMKMPTIVGIFIFISREILMLRYI